jgi:hypothetical protein
MGSKKKDVGTICQRCTANCLPSTFFSGKRLTCQRCLVEVRIFCIEQSTITRNAASGRQLDDVTCDDWSAIAEAVDLPVRSTKSRDSSDDPLNMMWAIREG